MSTPAPNGHQSPAWAAGFPNTGRLNGSNFRRPVGTGPGRIQNDCLSAESSIELIRRDILQQLAPPETFQKPIGAFLFKLLILRDNLGRRHSSRNGCLWSGGVRRWQVRYICRLPVVELGLLSFTLAPHLQQQCLPCSRPHGYPAPRDWLWPGNIHGSLPAIRRQAVSGPRQPCTHRLGGVRRGGWFSVFCC